MRLRRTDPSNNQRDPGRKAALGKSSRWGVVLAGGDGVRLQSLTRIICGDQRPKQFCPVFGSTTLLGATLSRIAPLIAQDHTLVSLNARHKRWYAKEKQLRPSQRIVQPANRGTAPPIVHSLLSIARRDANAVVAILPCDHHYTNEPKFRTCLESAFQSAEHHPGAVILLGAQPDYPEVEYGWIEMSPTAVDAARDVHEVNRFWEKPPLDVAQTLLSGGSLWNTFVMVGSVQAFLRLIETALPELTESLGAGALWEGAETLIEDSVYQRIPSTNFSHEVLSTNPGHLLVLRLADVGWSDLGDPKRVLSTARGIGAQPSWLPAWRLSESAVRGTRAAVA